MNLKKCKNQLLLFSVVLVFRMILSSFMHAIVLTNGYDEIGAIAGATFLLGDQWSHLLSARGSYYGFGYTILMTPLFLFFENPVTIYRGMLFYNSLCMALSAVIAYQMAVSFFRLDQKKSFVTALIVTTYPNHALFTNMIFNEAAIILLFWCSMYLCFSLCHKRNAGTDIRLTGCLLAIVLAYGMTIHTRFLLVIISVMVFIAFDCLLRRSLRQCIVSIPLFFGALILCLIISQLAVNYVQNTFYSTGDGALTNSVDVLPGIAAGLGGIVNRRVLQAYLYLVTGQIWGMIGLTGGLIAIIPAVLIIALRKCRRILKGASEDTLFDTAFLSYMAAICAMALIVFVSYISTAGAAAFNMEYLKKPQRFYLYTRYNSVFVDHFIMIALIFLIRTSEKISLRAKKLVLYSAGVITAIMIIGMLWKIAPKYDNYKPVYKTMVYIPYYPFMGMRYQSTFHYGHFVIFSVIAVIILSFVLFLWSRSARRGFLGLLLGLNVYAYVYIMVTAMIPASADNYIPFQNARPWVLNVVASVPDAEHITVSPYGSELYAHALQYQLYDMALNYDLELVKETDNQIVFAQKESDELLSYGFQKVTDQTLQTHVYVKGDALMNAVQN